MNEPQQAPREDRLMRHSFLLLVSSQVANVSNVLFHMVMGRNLTADEYGILAAMLNLLLIVATPLDALRGAMAHFTARAQRAGEPAVIRALLRRWVGRVSVLALPVAGLALVFRDSLAAFFHLATPLPIVLVALSLPAFLFAPVLAGALQGVQAFVWMALSVHGWGVVRLLLGLAFVLAGWLTATAGVSAHALGLLFGVLVGLLGVAAITRGAAAGGKATPGVGAYFINSLLLLAGYGILMNSDVMLVRHFQPDEAGLFSRAATIGRSVVFLPMPIAMAMFPKVISSGGSTHGSRTTLLHAFGLVALLIGAAVAATCALPWLPLRVLYDVSEPTPEMIHLVRVVTLAMSPLGLTYLLLNFEMAQHRFQTIPWLLILATAYLGGVALWHDTVNQIILVLGAVSLLSAILFAAAYGRAHQSR
jgi:O-antigen/teichoic acid export membrane protein